jgi:hypothetical protein
MSPTCTMNYSRYARCCTRPETIRRVQPVIAGITRLVEITGPDCVGR